MVQQSHKCITKCPLSPLYLKYLLFVSGESGATGQVVDVARHPHLKSQRGWYNVTWHKGTRHNAYRLGSEGKVDLIATEPSSGGYYYPTHLAALGSADSMPRTGEHNIKAKISSVQI